MNNVLSHITGSEHAQNSNLFHWLATNPFMFIGLIATVALIVVIIKFARR